MFPRRLTRKICPFGHETLQQLLIAFAWTSRLGVSLDTLFTCGTSYPVFNERWGAVGVAVDHTRCTGTRSMATIRQHQSRNRSRSSGHTSRFARLSQFFAHGLADLAECLQRRAARSRDARLRAVARHSHPSARRSGRPLTPSRIPQPSCSICERLSRSFRQPVPFVFASTQDIVSQQLQHIALKPIKHRKVDFVHSSVSHVVSVHQLPPPVVLPDL